MLTSWKPLLGKMASDLKDASPEVASDTAQKDDRFWHYPRGAIARWAHRKRVLDSHGRVLLQLSLVLSWARVLSNTLRWNIAGSPEFRGSTGRGEAAESSCRSREKGKGERGKGKGERGKGNETFPFHKRSCSPPHDPPAPFSLSGVRFLTFARDRMIDAISFAGAVGNRSRTLRWK